MYRFLGPFNTSSMSLPTFPSTPWFWWQPTGMKVWLDQSQQKLFKSLYRPLYLFWRTAIRIPFIDRGNLDNKHWAQTNMIICYLSTFLYKMLGCYRVDITQLIDLIFVNKMQNKFRSDWIPVLSKISTLCIHLDVQLESKYFIMMTRHKFEMKLFD